MRSEGANQKVFQTTEIKEILKSKMSEVREEVLVISAFVKLDALKWIDQYLSLEVRKKLVLRFRKSDILSGATDYEVVEYANQNGWDIKFDLRLHSKIFIFDQKWFLIGSANTTGSGLSLNRTSNIETVVSGSLDQIDLDKIYSIFDDALSFTPPVLEEMAAELQSSGKESGLGEWQSDLLHLLDVNGQKIIMTKDELLTSLSIYELTQHDKGLLGFNYEEGVDIPICELEEAFRQSKIYKWLLLHLMKKTHSNLYFGELTEMLHSDLAIKDSIRRREVKNSVINLLAWLTELDLDTVKVDRPNHSQRISLTEYK